MNNPRQTMLRLLAVALVPLAFWLQAGPVGAQTDRSDTPGVPDIAILVDDLDDEARPRLIDRLSDVDGVVRATADAVGQTGTVFYLDRSGDGGGRSAAAVASEAEQLITDEVGDSPVLVGGSALVDRALSGRFDGSARAVLFLAAAIGALLGLVFGWKRGLAAAAALALTVLCAANIGGQVGGRFDGTMSTTSLPGALAGLVVGTALAVRLMLWFRSPTGVDGAETIRRSILDLLPELALVFCGLLVAAVPVELLDPGRSPLTVVAISGLVAAIVLLAILAPALTVLADEPEPSPPLLPITVPDGRDFPLLILFAVGLVLTALSLFAYRQPARPLLDAERLAENSEPSEVAARLQVGGGDATNAIVARKPAGTTQVDFEGWAGAIVERPEVERVDIASGRFLSTGKISVDETALLVPPGAEGVAVIVLNVSPRSDAGQEVTTRLSGMPLAGGQPAFFGDAADAAGVSGSGGSVVVAVIVLALTGALGVQVLTQNAAQSAVALILRLIGGGASVGIYRLMITDATMAEILTVLVLISLGVGLFEMEFLQPVGERESGDPARQPNPGQNAAFGLLALAVAGLVVAVMVWFGGGPDTGRFGLGLLAAVIVELLSGVLLLRPALLGQRAAFHTAVRPVRIALHSGTDRQTDAAAGPEDPTWRRVVGDLLQAEFRLQSQPGDADLESVFVRDTPLYRQAATHHENLADAGLRIVGRSPRLRSLKTVSGRSPITLAVTVDHPERQLVDGEGSVVGVRKPERRSGVLWLSDGVGGSYRIAESVELGSVPLPGEGGAAIDTDQAPQASQAPVPEQPLTP